LFPVFSGVFGDGSAAVAVMNGAGVAEKIAIVNAKNFAEDQIPECSFF
jgi:hypothetical protein